MEDWESAELDTNVVLYTVSDKDYQEFSLKELKVKLKVMFYSAVWVYTGGKILSPEWRLCVTFH